MEKEKNNETFPSVESRESLNKLSQSFKPTDVKFLLALKSKFSLEECTDNANEMIKRLEKFVENGNSDEGLGFQYQKISIF